MLEDLDQAVDEGERRGGEERDRAPEPTEMIDSFGRERFVDGDIF
jgi:hypothetical protein